MLRIDALFQALQFAFQSTGLGVVTLKQTRLEPAVKMLHAAVPLRATGRDQQRLGPEAQAQTQHTREIASGRSPPDDFASIVELDLFRQSQILPALAQEVKMTSILRER